MASNNKKIFVFISLISIIALLVISSKFSEREIPSLNQKEISQWYQVEYPQNFFITHKNLGLFMVAEKRWEGHAVNYPTAQIRVYSNVIPTDMSLEEWLEGVSDPNPPIGGFTPKSCRNFFYLLKRDFNSGDLYDDSSLAKGNCIHLGVSNINISQVSLFDALQFDTQYVSSSSTHTIFKYKINEQDTLLIDMSFKSTGLSEENDHTKKAYESFIKTFKIR